MNHANPNESPEAPILAAALRARRKALGISVTAAAEAARVSRVTWHRLEKGEPTVALGTLLAAARVLGMAIRLQEHAAGAPVDDDARREAFGEGSLPLRIRLEDFPQLRSLAWQVGHAAQTLTPREALGLYERNWRHMQPALLTPDESRLIAALREVFGSEELRV